jgi:hypothetical protein
MRRSCCLLLLLSLALVLAACASVDATLELHEDGSGTRTVLVLVDETSYNLAKTSGMGDPLAQIAAEAGRRGATVEPYSEFARQGLRITQTFDRLGDIPPLPPLDDVTATRHSDLLGTHYAVTVTVDTSQLAAMTRGVEQLPLSSLKLTYNVALPGRIQTHNAAFVAGNTLTWTLDPTVGDVQTLTATSEVPHDLTVPYVAAAVALVTIPLVVAGGLALLSARQRRRDERPSTILSGCLGLAMLLTLLVCLVLALLAGYLTLEGRIFPISPLPPAPAAPGEGSRPGVPGRPPGPAVDPRAWTQRFPEANFLLAYSPSQH